MFDVLELLWYREKGTTSCVASEGVEVCVLI